MAFRQKNFLHRGERLVETVGPLDADMDDLVHRAITALDWDGRSQRVGPHAGAVYIGTTPVRGRGIAATFRHGYSGTSVSDVEVTADNRGIIRILHSGAEIGQGLYTMLARVASEALIQMIGEADDQPKAYLDELIGFVAGGVEAQLRPTPC